MTSATLTPIELTVEAFAAFGDVIEVSGEPDRLINGGRCGRYHDLAKLDFHSSGQAGINLFRSQPVSLPLRIELVERHPLGSQCFIPLTGNEYLVVVGDDDNGEPRNLQAFLARSHQGVNYHRNVWHGVLMPIGSDATFAVVDWIGQDQNLEEFHFRDPIEISAPGSG